MKKVAVKTVLAGMICFYMSCWPIIDFVKNGDKMLAISNTGSYKDSLLYLSVDNGKTFENFTSPNLFQGYASNVINVSFSGADEAVITLGSVVFQQTTRNQVTTIPVHSFAKGTYKIIIN